MMDPETSQSMDRNIRTTCEVCGAAQDSEQERTKHQRATGHREFKLEPRGPSYVTRTG